MTITVAEQLSRRDLGLLDAVAHGRVQCSASSEPDFYIDGFPYCDHFAARLLIRAGLLSQPAAGSTGERQHVQLTAEGRQALDAA